MIKKSKLKLLLKIDFFNLNFYKKQKKISYDLQYYNLSWRVRKSKREGNPKVLINFVWFFLSPALSLLLMTMMLMVSHFWHYCHLRQSEVLECIVNHRHLILHQRVLICLCRMCASKSLRKEPNSCKLQKQLIAQQFDVQSN